MRLAWLKEFLNPDRRDQTRRGMPGIVAYYWDGSSARAHSLLNVSSGGFYMLTEERWYPDTILKITLENTSGAKSESWSGTRMESGAICLLARVARSGPDGVGLQFVFPGEAGPAFASRFPDCSSDRRELQRFLERVENDAKTAGSRTA